MRFQRLRRVLLAATCLASLLSACGGGSETVSKFIPGRLVTFGDAFSDIGQRGGRQYTANVSPVNWTQNVALAYGLPLAASSAGGTSYAIGSARVVATPDAQGNASTPTIAMQVDAFLAAGGPQAPDAILVQGGIADLIAEAQLELNGQQDSATTTANVAAAGAALGQQVRRLVNAGAKHVMVLGAYNLGRTPWATARGANARLEALTTRFNDSLLVSIVDLGSHVLYSDIALLFNLVTANPLLYGYENVVTPLCTSVDPGPGIGIGPNQVNSALCTASTLNPALVPGSTLYADPVYFTPPAHATLGEMVANQLRNRF
ncbi:SGNH/GDSL hydrolase family protein [Ramlibacter algicola]|uniref:SGNH/GDSL hydrolase family protein n=1 Tax=Ramlibacter algicola TaxID=2795217 RepID=UPI001EF0ABD2|nr:SGNH/GDSL hydrolase family protein [Ramlibacter algicola]